MFFHLGTDRHNVVQIPDPNSNYPLPWEQMTMWNNSELIWKNDATWTNNTILSSVDIAVAFASGGYYGCYESSTCGAMSVETKSTRLNRLLNNVRASFDGAVLKFKSGVYHYICSRNNNFTNRSQKGMLVVRSS